MVGGENGSENASSASAPENQFIFQAECHCRKLNGTELMAKLVEGVRLIDGDIEKAT